MNSALIVSCGEQSIAFFGEMLSKIGVLKVTRATCGGEARRLLIESDFDLCLINAPLPDEMGDALAQGIAQRGTSEVLLVVRSELYDEISDKVESLGVITVSRPVNKALFWSALKVAQAAHARLRKVESENRQLLQKIEDIRVVDRAKCILISYLGMTEPEAHKYVEKQAMDMRTTKRAAAEQILQVYEN